MSRRATVVTRRSRTGSSTSRSRVMAVVVVLAIACAAAPSAHADGVPYADDGALPWSSGATVKSPLELFASQLASRAVRKEGLEARCEGQTDWNALGAQKGFDPRRVFGYVMFTQPTRSGVPAGALVPHYLMELAPVVCDHLNRFALAAEKPTTCRAPTTVSETVTRLVTVQTPKRVAVTVRTPVTKAVKQVVNGKTRWVVKTVMVPVKKWKTVTVTEQKEVSEVVQTEVLGEPAPCYLGAGKTTAEMSSEYWSEYILFVEALQTVSHEAAHLAGIDDEASAHCQGLQNLAWWARQFGASVDDADAIALYFWEKRYPRNRGTEYWSSSCRDGGPLDIFPDISEWP